MQVRLDKSQLVGVGWTTWVVLALLILPVLDGPAYGGVVVVSALILAVIPGTVPRVARARDLPDLLVVAVLYVTVVALMRLAFVGFTTDNTLGLFLSLRRRPGPRRRRSGRLHLVDAAASAVDARAAGR